MVDGLHSKDLKTMWWTISLFTEAKWVSDSNSQFGKYPDNKQAVSHWHNKPFKMKQESPASCWAPVCPVGTFSHVDQQIIHKYINLFTLHTTHTHTPQDGTHLSVVCVSSVGERGSCSSSHSSSSETGERHATSLYKYAPRNTSDII